MLFRSATDPHESYELTEDFVKSGYGRSSVCFDFKKVRVMVLSAKYIELHGKTKRMRIYVPEEDYNFVRGHIQSRAPMECEIRHDSSHHVRCCPRIRRPGAEKMYLPPDG